MKVYFDNAATTPIRKEAIEVMFESMEATYGNPSSSHSFGRSAKSIVENARKSISKILNCNPQEIIFTSGGTESDNSILNCAVRDLGVKKIISSPIEHHAVLETLEELKKKGIDIQLLELEENGLPKISSLERLLSADNSMKLVSLMHINNEIGNILDLKLIGNLIKNHGALFHSDAVQGIGHFKYDLKTLPIDFLSASGHKFHGPKGIGFSFMRKNLGLDAFIFGGPQERGLRAGTEPVHNIIGMQKALEIAYENFDEEKEYTLELKKYFINQINNLFPEVHFNGLCQDLELSTYTIVNVALPLSNSKSQLIDFHLDLNNIACSKGSACQSGVSNGSHVLESLKRNDQVINRPSLRFSFSSFNTKKEIDYVIKILAELKEN
tara:strand:+ start:279 stop:1424 length:1146 start_codon:yes stop_codon:yes gene_type:complete